MPQQQERRITVPGDGHVPTQLRKWLSDMMDLFSDGVAVLSIQRPTRSNDQNRLLWGVVYPQVHQGLKQAGVHDLHLMDDDGHVVDIPITVQFIHKVMKRRHLTPDEPGEEPTTTTLTTTEMSEYIRAIRHDPLVTKHEIHIRMPQETPMDAYDA